MPIVIVALVIGLFYLGADGTHRLDKGNNAIGMTEIVIAVVVGLFLYIAEYQSQMLGKYGRRHEE